MTKTITKKMTNMIVTMTVTMMCKLWLLREVVLRQYW